MVCYYRSSDKLTKGRCEHELEVEGRNVAACQLDLLVARHRWSFVLHDTEIGPSPALFSPFLLLLSLKDLPDRPLWCVGTAITFRVSERTMLAQCDQTLAVAATYTYPADTSLAEID